MICIEDDTTLTFIVTIYIDLPAENKQRRIDIP